MGGGQSLFWVSSCNSPTGLPIIELTGTLASPPALGTVVDELVLQGSTNYQPFQIEYREKVVSKTCLQLTE